MHFEELGGIVQLVAFAAAAFVLNFMEQFEGAPGLAGEAMAVDADLGEGALVLEESEGWQGRFQRPDAWLGCCLPLR